MRRNRPLGAELMNKLNGTTESLFYAFMTYSGDVDIRFKMNRVW